MIMTDALYQRLFEVFKRSRKITDEAAVIKSNLQAWVTAGLRYHKICSHLGKSALFLIPEIPDRMWENIHALNGSKLHQAIAHLKHRGIMEISKQFGADQLASQIMNSVIDPFRWDNTMTPTFVPSPNTSIAPTPNAPIANGYTLSTQAESSTSEINPNSIYALLNPLFNPEEAIQLQPGEPLSKPRRADPPPCLDQSASQSSSGVVSDRYGGKVDECYLRAPGVGREVPMADVNKLKSIIGPYLFDAAMRSHTRRQDNQSIPLTDTVRLRVPLFVSQDFQFYIWVCSSAGKAISKAKMGPVKNLRDILGDYLFEAMKASDQRKKEIQMGRFTDTRAVNVSFGNNDDDGDFRVEIMLIFSEGRMIWINTFPS
ncbi:hypothetical protein OCU04_008289 [Sclerotinia nivalis]|nr:hypothetical protein OCU04_008289 [Sclerotinia nivalis]